jgi:hypothetical protein
MRSCLLQTRSGADSRFVHVTMKASRSITSRRPRSTASSNVQAHAAPLLVA